MKRNTIIFTSFLFSLVLLIGATTARADTFYLNLTNGFATCSTDCASVTIDVTSTTATFTVTSGLNGYVFDNFSFNAGIGGDATTPLTLSLTSVTGTLQGPTPPPDPPSQQSDGFGAFDYTYLTGFTGGSQGSQCTVSGGVPSAGCTFTFTVSGTGFALIDFTIDSTGGNGTGYFSGHMAAGDDYCTGYVGGIDGSESHTLGGTGNLKPDCGPTTTPEPGSISLLLAGLLGLAGIVRRRLRG